MKPKADGNPAVQQNIQTIAEMEKVVAMNRSLGERVADYFSAIIGSWTFIAIQSVLLLGWLALNIAGIVSWDPYPFILLNLLLSFQAAYASPIIMMSQNRQDRLAARRNQLDLQINLLAEQEGTELLRLLRALCEKSGVDYRNESVAPGLAEATEPRKIVQLIKDHVENKPQNS